MSCQNSDIKQVPHWGCKNIGGTVQNIVAWHPGFVHLCTTGSVCAENLWQFLLAVMPLKVIYNNYVTVVYVIGYTKIVDSKPCQDACKWQSYIQIQICNLLSGMWQCIVHQMFQWNLCCIPGDHNLNMRLHGNLKSLKCEFVFLFLVSQNYEVAVS